jgi:hypothetical protein
VRHSVVRIGYAALPWLVGGLFAAACTGSEDDAFTVSYREKEPVRKPSSTADASVVPDASKGGVTGGATGGCNPQFCQSNGSFQGCCTAAGVCGVDFGFGLCSTLPPDAGFGSGGAGGRRGTGGRPSTEDAGQDADTGAPGSGGHAAGGAPGTGGHSTQEPDASADASLD